MKKQRLLIKFFLAVLVGTFFLESFSLFAQEIDNKSVLSVQNEFLKLMVNSKAQDTGRFSIETIVGDPQNPRDDNSPLIFGRPAPWTSYTTILIDSLPHVFGGVNTKISKRGGQKPIFGDVVGQASTPEGLITQTFFPAPKIRVIQRLSFVRNPSTKVQDMAMIHYEVINEDAVPHTIGLRLMMDTKLGQNDAAPFRIGANAVTSEMMLSGGDLMDYWQTFDSLSSPNVIAQGVLRQPELGVAAPDRMYLVNWGTLVDYPWEFTYQEGRSFMRAGEEENDTSLAMYWDATPLPPGGRRQYKTLYGLGGVTLQPGALSLGLTAPAEVHATSKKEILIMAYVHNSGGFDSQNTVLEFTLPEGFALTQGTAVMRIGRLKAGTTRQVPIKVVLQDAPIGTARIKVKVTSDTLDTNSASRAIEIIGVPELRTEFSVTPFSDNPLNLFYDAKLKVYNPSRKSVDGVKVTLTPQEGVKIPAFDFSTKTLATIPPNTSTVFDWKMKLLQNKNTTASVVTIVQSDVTPTQRKVIYFSPNDFPEKYFIYPSKTDLKVGDVFYVTLLVHHAKHKDNQLVELDFNPEILEVIRWSPEPWLFSMMTPPAINEGSFVLGPISWPELIPEMSICKVHFRVIKPGSSQLTLKQRESVKAERSIIVQGVDTPREIDQED